MEQVRTLVTEYFDSRENQLVVGRFGISELADAYGTPLFVYSAAIAERKLGMLKAALPRDFSIAYSVKANPQPAYLNLFLAQGCSLEVASAGELYQALNAGCGTERILFAGPGKTESELEFALSRGIGEIHAESFTEIRRIGALCRRLNKRARVALRINQSSEGQGGAMRMGGKPAPFGIDEEALDEAIACLQTESSLVFSGVHVFTGTQILDHNILISQYQRGLDIARRAAARSGQAIATLDFGGGLGIPYFSHEHSLDLNSLGRGLRELFAGIRDEACFEHTNFLIEPGRFLVGESGVYLTRVIDIKVSRGKKFLITDGGMHHHLAASGNLGQTIKRNYPVAIVNKLDEPLAESVDIVGPLCTPLDVLARGVTLPAAEIGDLIGVFQSGAYARSASPLGFLSHPAPAEAWVSEWQHSLVRRRGAISDCLADVVSPVVEQPAHKSR
jgi:diaminopimelate decarboxylase